MGAGLAHFGLALFLKGGAVVAAPGDRSRIVEFFDGLMTTDFYKHYGLFVAGARVGEIRPHDAEGNPSPDGIIALVSISMSNATQEFSFFKHLKIAYLGSRTTGK